MGMKDVFSSDISYPIPHSFCHIRNKLYFYVEKKEV